MIGELSTIAGAMFKGELERGGGVQRARRRPSRTGAAGSGGWTAPSPHGSGESADEILASAAAEGMSDQSGGHWDSGTATPDLATLLGSPRHRGADPSLTDASPTARTHNGTNPEFVREAEAEALTARMEIQIARIDELKRRMEDVFGFDEARSHARSAYRTENGAPAADGVLDIRG